MAVEKNQKRAKNISPPAVITGNAAMIGIFNVKKEYIIPTHPRNTASMVKAIAAEFAIERRTGCLCQMWLN